MKVQHKKLWDTATAMLREEFTLEKYIESSRTTLNGALNHLPSEDIRTLGSQ